ncbi:MAG: hypothetical protein IJT65_00960 [Eubacterium sp.]|nr:hypothetical protein [Eubacterium sp.]
MNSLVSSFFKRAVVIPGIIAVVVIALILVVTPSLIAASNVKEETVEAETIDLSQFNAKKYSSISKLKKDDYVGSFECEDIAFSEAPIVYDAKEVSNVSAIKGSVEPWGNKKGGVVLRGATTHQLAPFTNAKIGDTIKVNYYGNNTYFYKVNEIIPTAQASDFNKYLKDNKLTVAVPYNDFAHLGEAYFYTLYVAELR